MLGAAVVAMARAFDLGEHDLTVDPELGTVVVPISAGAPALTQALRALDAEHVPIIDVSLRRPSLDDVFLNLTGHHADDEIREEQPEPRPHEQEEARHMTAVSTPLGTATAAQASDDHTESARDGRVAARRAQPAEDLATPAPHRVLDRAADHAAHPVRVRVRRDRATSATRASPTRTSSFPRSSCRRWCSPASSRASGSPTT